MNCFRRFCVYRQLKTSCKTPKKLHKKNHQKISPPPSRLTKQHVRHTLLKKHILKTYLRCNSRKNRTTNYCGTATARIIGRYQNSTKFYELNKNKEYYCPVDLHFPVSSPEAILQPQIKTTTQKLVRQLSVTCFMFLPSKFLWPSFFVEGNEFSSEKSHFLF